MNKRVLRWLQAVAFALVALLPLGAAAQTSDKPFGNEQLDQMLAQVALYPDSLLSQVLMAATYPDEFAAAAAWSKAHPDAKGDDAVQLVANQPWDPSVASLVAFPEVLITLGEKPDYVRNLGDAFLAQPEDVMNSVQRLRQNAQKAGNLKSNEQIKVSTEPAPAPTTVVVQQAAPPSQVIVIEPAQPSVVYVPAYNPTIVYGPWWYPAYPPYYYPPPPGYWFSRTIATGIAWGVGIGVSNALWGGFNWGNHDVDINVNRYNNINVNRRLDVDAKRTTWNHDSSHRGKTAYRGGDATKQKLDKKRDAGNREQFRGKDGARDGGRDASRERAAQTMKDRGEAADKAGGVASAAGPDRDAARQRAQAVDKDAAKTRAQSGDRDNALRGANSANARQQADRGAASQKAAQRSGGGRPGGGGGGGGGGGRKG